MILSLLSGSQDARTGHNFGAGMHLMVMHPFLLTAVLTATLVLHSGARIAIDGPVREEDGVVTFRSAGALYSIAASEVDRVEPGKPEAPPEAPVSVPSVEPALRLRVSADERKRLLDELEKNHNGTPAPEEQLFPTAPPPPTAAERRAERNEEASWRRRAHAYDESVLQAKEDLALLEARIEELESKIRGLLALGYEQRQFTYDTRQLLLSREQLPAARLRVTRAERARDRFREEARRAGIPPGWLR